MPEHQAPGPRPHQPGPDGSRLDAVERLRRQLEALDSRGKSRGRAKSGSRTSDPWAPTSRWDEGNSKEPAARWDSGSSADESARSATNAKHIADAWSGAESTATGDAWDTTDARAAGDPWAPTSNSDAADEATSARDTADFRRTGVNPQDAGSEEGSSSAGTAALNTQRPQGRSPFSGRRQPHGQREEAPPAPGDADRSDRPPFADGVDGRPRSGSKPSPADESHDDQVGARPRASGWPYDDDPDDDSRGGRRRGRRRGSARGDSADEGNGSRGDDDSREGGRARKPRRLPGEPLPDGGTEVQAKDACLRLLTDRARSRAELADRLATKGFSPEIANKALDRLTEVGLIDDAAFAQQWVYSRHTYSGKGKKALAQELRRKGVAQEEADEALSTITPDDELSRATDLVRRKIRSLPANLDRDKATRRLVGMLARRGYNPGTAYTVVKAELAAAGALFAGADDLPGEDD